MVKGPDHSFAYIPARDAGVSPASGFGGSYVTFDFSSLPGKAGNYEYALIPHAVISPYLTYTSDGQNWGAHVRRHLCLAHRPDRAAADHLSRLCHLECIGFLADGICGRWT